MMLSPQAARMGTAMRCLGKASLRRSYESGSIGSRRVVTLHTLARNDGKIFGSDTFIHQQLKNQRFKSTTGVAAAFESDSDDDEEPRDLGYTHLGHAVAAEYRAKNVLEEPWRINLGRGNDNAWLMGPRDEQEWFTGVAPVNDCPGKLNWWIFLKRNSPGH